MEYNAYHFVGATLRDGSPVPPDGETLKWTGELIMCRSGLHASRKPWQALEYAPGPTLCRVHCAGETINGDDKLVCRERTIIARIDATDILRRYARACALDVAHLWDCPNVVMDYLNTGDDSKRDAAWDAAGAAGAAWNAAKAARAARNAAGDAARAARNAAGNAARNAAGNAAGDAAKAKQRRRFTRLVNDAFGGTP